MSKHENPIEEALLALEAGLRVISLAHEHAEDPASEEALSTALAALATGHALVSKHLEDPQARQEPQRAVPMGMGQEEDECEHERTAPGPAADSRLCLDCAAVLDAPIEKAEDAG